MSSETIDLLWDDSIAKLKQLLQEEDDVEKKSCPSKNESTLKPAKSTSTASTILASIPEAFHHFAKLYIQYTMIASDLNSCYKLCIQPQKRQDLKVTLEHVLIRILNLRHQLVKWCPPNPDVDVTTITAGGAGLLVQESFPWEYFDIHKEMKELHCTPSRLEMTTPVYFGEDQKDTIQCRNSTIIQLMIEKFGCENIYLEHDKIWKVNAECMASSTIEMMVNPSIDMTTADVQIPESFDTSSHAEVSPDEYKTQPELAALLIQQIVRGHLTRKFIAGAKKWLESYIGIRMDSSSSRPDFIELEQNLAGIRKQKMEEQQHCMEAYETDLHRLKDVVQDEEGFAMKNELREERIQWITEQTIKNNMLPNSFHAFYESQKPIINREINKELNNSPRGRQSKENTAVSETKEVDQASKGKKTREKECYEQPLLHALPSLLDPMRQSIQIYYERWQKRNIGPDRISSQHHDTEMAKKWVVRDQVKSELTKNVEDKLLANIMKINGVQDAASASTQTSHLKEMENEEKKNINSGKKSGTKERPLPGELLSRMRDKSIDEMLIELVHNGLVFIPKGFLLKDFIGGYECDLPVLPKINDHQRWVPNHPSAFQLRKSVMEYCIIPIGSEFIASNIQDNEKIRSILFYGPEGSGKTHMVQTIASELGALLIHLSSSLIGNLFKDKDEATSLIHMVFTIAKSKAFAPVIIYIDNCHDFFLGEKKPTIRGGTSLTTTINAEMQRFQKDLLVYKNQALKKEDRVIVIGCTNLPEYSDVKVLMRKEASNGNSDKQGFFDKSLYFPRASHTDREMLWDEFIRKRLFEFKIKQEDHGLDFNTLAHMSDGFSAGEILYVVNSVLTKDRVNDALHVPLLEHEFTRFFSLGKECPKYITDDARFLNFTRQITNLDLVWTSRRQGENSEQQTKRRV